MLNFKNKEGKVVMTLSEEKDKLVVMDKELYNVIKEKSDSEDVSYKEEDESKE